MKRTIGALVAVVVTAATFAACGVEIDPEQEQSPTAEEQAQENVPDAADADAATSEEPVEDEADSGPEAEESDEPEESDEREETLEQANARATAEDYIEYSGFSKSGLIDQLEFEGFSKKDAKYAVNHIDVDWMEQAERTATDYMDYSSFSRSGLIEQLEFEGYTREQAEHGADSVGF
jgi:type IV secretory pathway VirB10-like protein